MTASRHLPGSQASTGQPNRARATETLVCRQLLTLLCRAWALSTGLDSGWCGRGNPQIIHGGCVDSLCPTQMRTCLFGQLDTYQGNGYNSRLADSYRGELDFPSHRRASCPGRYRPHCQARPRGSGEPLAAPRSQASGSRRSRPALFVTHLLRGLAPPLPRRLRPAFRAFLPSSLSSFLSTLCVCRTKPPRASVRALHPKLASILLRRSSPHKTVSAAHPARESVT